MHELAKIKTVRMGVSDFFNGYHVPACIVLWLILFDDLADERALWKRQREYYANCEDWEEGE